MAFASDIRTLESNLAHRIAAFTKSALQRVENYRMYRRTVKELAALDNRELADLGLSRSMIKGVALEAVYGR